MFSNDECLTVRIISTRKLLPLDLGKCSKWMMHSLEIITFHPWFFLLWQALVQCSSTTESTMWYHLSLTVMVMPQALELLSHLLSLLIPNLFLWFCQNVSHKKENLSNSKTRISGGCKIYSLPTSRNVPDPGQKWFSGIRGHLALAYGWEDGRIPCTGNGWYQS
jgi:hypothetical protein